MAIGDQQFGLIEFLADRTVDLRVFDLPDPVQGAVLAEYLGPGFLALDRRGDHRPGVTGGQREDRREVEPGGPGQVEPVLLRAGLGPLVGPDPAGPVILDPHPGEDRVADLHRTVGPGELLRQGPDRGFTILFEDAAEDPLFKGSGCVFVGVATGRLRQVDLDHVER